MVRIIFLIFTLTSLLSGCTAGVSVATTGAQAVYNRHALNKKLTDQYITMRSNRKIYTETDRYKDSNISVAVYDSNVLLTGEVSNPTFRKEITHLIKTIPEVDEVHNMLTVSTPSSALTHVSDSWLTAKIKAQFIASNEVDPSQIKVVTENGTVFLMGTILPEQAIAAVNVARNTAGVQSVVKIFNYIRISKK
jgi:osmotically-inducible protein OsmY